MRLQDKIAIVTGAAGGMGEASAILFAAEGAKVAVVDLREETAEATAATIRAAGGTAIAIGADVTRTADVQRIVERTVAELGLPNVLVNNAGVDLEGKKPLFDVAEEDFDRTVAVNLKSVWLMMKHVTPRMIEAGGGSIVNIASIAPFVTVASIGYSASKAGAVTMSKVAAIELGKFNIRVNALCPGATETPMAKHEREKMRAAGYPPSTDNIITRMTALGRMAQPIEMAKMALFLASDDSSYATGGIFVNDGGWSSNGGVEMRG